MVRLLIFSLLIAFVGSNACAQDETARIVGDCDRLAASSLDLQRPASVSGIAVTAVDPKTAVPACEAALKVSPDDRRILFQLGRAYAQAKDFEKARTFLAKADALGHFLATNNLGAIYASGNGVPVDFAEARRLYEKAAAGGVTIAMDNLGDFYRLGKGVPVDFGQAKLWYEKAAALGFTPTLVKIGFLYDKGYGVPVNYAEARRWYDKAFIQAISRQRHGLDCNTTKVAA
jgi:tetratricopeptide (TPR) repeat protein